MAWEWSHTHEGVAAACDNVHKLRRQELITILREWSAYDREKRAEADPGYRLPATTRGLFRLTFNPRRLVQETLADAVIERMTEHATCDNGGFDAHACPYGCHTVSFDGGSDAH